MAQKMIKQSVNGARGDGVLVSQDEHRPIRQIVDLVDEGRIQRSRLSLVCKRWVTAKPRVSPEDDPPRAAA